MTRGRKTTLNFVLLGALFGALLMTAAAYADVQEFTDKDEWIDAVGKFTTIDFTGFPAGTWITDQYADFGILFTDGDDWIHNTCGFVNDCWGLAGRDGNDQITLVFDAGEAYIGVDFPGDLQIDLYIRGRLIHSSVFIAGGHGNFAGVVSSALFDSVVLSDPVFGFVSIDDLHFGPPGPGKCPWDLDRNGSVGVSDLLSLLGTWGPCPPNADCPADFDSSDDVGVSDFLELLGNWGPCP